MPIILAHTAPSRLDWHGLQRLTAQGPRPPPTAAPAPSPVQMQDQSFVALQGAYRASGGLERGDDLALRMLRAGRGGYQDLARQIVGGELFSFHWNDSFWLPAFQLDPVTLAPHAQARSVVSELQGVFDGWDMAWWFVNPHADLGGRRPLDLLVTALPAVLAAARADRFAIDS